MFTYLSEGVPNNKRCRIFRRNTVVDSVHVMSGWLKTTKGVNEFLCEFLSDAYTHPPTQQHTHTFSTSTLAAPPTRGGYTSSCPLPGPPHCMNFIVVPLARLSNRQHHRLNTPTLDTTYTHCLQPGHTPPPSPPPCAPFRMRHDSRRHFPPPTPNPHAHQLLPKPTHHSSSFTCTSQSRHTKLEAICTCPHTIVTSLSLQLH